MRELELTRLLLFTDISVGDVPALPTHVRPKISCLQEAMQSIPTA
jgi:hypothetical protein